MTHPLTLSRRRLLAGAAAAAAVCSTRVTLAEAANSPITKPIPSSGEQIPVIGLGTSRTLDIDPNGPDFAQLKQVMQVFCGRGGTVVDTSPMYGRAENVSGRLASALAETDNLFWATKVWTDGRASGIEQMQRSADLMGTDVIDLMQVHNLRDLDTHLASVRELRDAGKVRYVGITHYTASAHDALEKVMQAEPLDFVQLNYSIAERQAENRLLPLAQEKGIAIMVNRPFARARLFSAVQGKEVPAWAQELGMSSWAQVFLKFVVSHPAVTVAIPATSKPHHMEDNMAGGQGELLTEKQRERVAGLIA